MVYFDKNGNNHNFEIFKIKKSLWINGHVFEKSKRNYYYQCDYESFMKQNRFSDDFKEYLNKIIKYMAFL